MEKSGGGEKREELEAITAAPDRGFRGQRFGCKTIWMMISVSCWGSGAAYRAFGLAGRAIAIADCEPLWLSMSFGLRKMDWEHRHKWRGR